LTAGHLPPDGSLLEPVLWSRLTAPLTSSPSVGGPGQLAIEINLWVSRPNRWILRLHIGERSLHRVYIVGTGDTHATVLLCNAAAQMPVGNFRRGEGSDVYVSPQVGDSVVIHIHATFALSMTKMLSSICTYKWCVLGSS